MAANPSIQLGTDGNWAIKEDNLLAYKKDGTRFFNKEFDFNRNTTATFVGKNGLIQQSAANTPRVDFKDDITGHLLLEPQSTNLITYSEDFSQVYWTETSLTVSASTITDPSGNQNSFKLVPNSSNGGNKSLSRNFTSLSGLCTHSVFAKKGEYNYIALRTRNAPNVSVMFDLENGTFNVNVTSAAFNSAKIENYGNGWYKCSMTLDSSQMTGVGQIFTSFSVGITGSETHSFDGNGTSGVYIWGAQLEELPYATSYIPTSGSVATRLKDQAYRSGLQDNINSTEGVLYAEIAGFADDGTTRRISISDGSNNNRSSIELSNGVAAVTRNSGSNQSAISDTTIVVTNFNKIAYKFKENDFTFFINGTNIGSNTSGSVPSGQLRLAFDRGDGSSIFYGRVKDLRVYNTALSDEDLQKLTNI